MASVSEKNGNSVSGGKPERGGLTGSGTGLEPKPIRVSVIDDDPMICQAMSLILNDYSHGRIEVVSTSTDGETCVRRAAEEKPDVVLMDIAMPGVDGIEATRLLRSLSPAPHVLILTSLSPSGRGTRGGGGRRGVRVENRCGGRYHPPHHRGMRGRAAVQHGQSETADRRSERHAAAFAPR